MYFKMVFLEFTLPRLTARLNVAVRQGRAGKSVFLENDYKCVKFFLLSKLLKAIL